jgi:hypothetical protein
MKCDNCLISKESKALRDRIIQLEAEVEYQTGKKKTIFELCRGTIERKKAKIVELEARLKDAEKMRDDWRSDSNMFSRAWARELGPIRHKTHLIDALVMGTRELQSRVFDAGKLIPDLIKIFNEVLDEAIRQDPFTEEASELLDRGHAAIKAIEPWIARENEFKQAKG